MSDETELNPRLPEKQVAIEASLRGLALPESAIDHDGVMYQAGWAAAMAERDSHSPSVSKMTPSRFWPALAMTFAATTAACLVVILMPSSESGIAVATNDTTPHGTVESENTNSTAMVQGHQVEAMPHVESPTPVADTSQRFGLARLFGNSVQKMMARRNAQFQLHLAEAISPSRVVLTDADDDQDFEPSVPLTPRSPFSFSL